MIVDVTLSPAEMPKLLINEDAAYAAASNAGVDNSLSKSEPKDTPTPADSPPATATEPTSFQLIDSLNVFGTGFALVFAVLTLLVFTFLDTVFTLFALFIDFVLFPVFGLSFLFDGDLLETGCL